MRYIRKYPNCHGEIIIDNLTEEEAYQKEKETIADYLSKGYNLTNFDEGGRPGGRCPGEANGMYGKTHTPEAIQKIKEANVGKVRSKNSNAKICEIYDLNMNFIVKFNCIMDAIDWMISQGETSTSKRSLTTYIGRYELGQTDSICHKYKLKIYRHNNEENTVPSLGNKEGVTAIESITNEKNIREEVSRVEET